MKVFWKDVEKTILIRKSPETLLWEDYDKAAQRTYEMLQEVKHDVFLILDGSRIEYVPRDALNYFSKANEHIPPHVVMRILVTRNSLVRSLTKALEKIMPDKLENLHYAYTMDEALEKIAQEKAKRQAT
jgi:hypothetical protein